MKLPGQPVFGLIRNDWATTGCGIGKRQFHHRLWYREETVTPQAVVLRRGNCTTGCGLKKENFSPELLKPG